MFKIKIKSSFPTSGWVEGIWTRNQGAWIPVNPGIIYQVVDRDRDQDTILSVWSNVTWAAAKVRFFYLTTVYCIIYDKLFYSSAMK